MKRTWKLIMSIIILLFIIPSLPVSAEETETYEYTMDDAIDASGADNLGDAYSDDVKDFLQKYGIDTDNADSFLSLTPKDVFDEIFGQIKASAQEPLRLFIGLMVAVMLSALIGSMGETAIKNGSSCGKVFDIITVLVCVMLLIEPITECIENTAAALESGSTFMLSFIPVFAVVSVGSGEILSAGAYNMLIVAAAEIAVQISSNILIPVVSMCMAMSVISSINAEISLDGFVNGIKKAVTWTMGIIMTVFTGLLSLQSIIGNSADTVTAKTAKFMVSNIVPVVGGAVSDAYSAVRGSFGLLQGAVGGIGIIAVLVYTLPCIISLGLYRLAISGAQMFAEMFGSSKITSLLKSFSSSLAIAFSIMVSFAVMFVISTAIVMALAV